MNTLSPRRAGRLLAMASVGWLPLAAGAVDGTALAGGDASPRWTVQLPGEARLDFHGVVSFDDAGFEGPPVQYPAPNLAGFLAAVVTHGIIMDTARKEQKARLKASADAILSHYAPVLDRFEHAELKQRANGIAARRGKPGALEPVVESIPTFSLTQDERAVVLDNAILFRGEPAGTAGVYQGIVRVVSRPVDAADPRAHWIAGDGSRLKEVCAGLLVESIDVALLDARLTGTAAPPPQRTVRYLQGGAERIERAQVIRNDCGRLVLRSLRGVLMSVPARSSDEAPTENCPIAP